MSQNPSGATIKLPDFPKSWGPFLAFVAAISLSAFSFAAFARTDSAVVVIGVVASTAMLVALVAKLKGVI
jgi:hypothetical protein